MNCVFCGEAPERRRCVFECDSGNHKTPVYVCEHCALTNDEIDTNDDFFLCPSCALARIELEINRAKRKHESNMNLLRDLRSRYTDN